MQSHITQNAPLFLGIAAILALIIAGLFQERKEREADKSVLRHTININLGILRHEYAQLMSIAENAQPSADVTTAKALLTAVAITSESAKTTIKSHSRQKLQDLLSDVFGAMSKSTNARHLLGACQPFTDWT